MPKNNEGIQIPNLNRDGSLVSRFIPIILIGADSVLDKESNLYIRLFVRLVDKAFSEYMDAKEYIEKELKTGDKLAYGFNIINHLENCLNAISRVMNVFTAITVGIKRNGKITTKAVNILNFVDQRTIEAINNSKVRDVRNRVEHIEEDILFNEFNNDLFIKIDDKYQNICINNKCISFLELAQVIGNFHNFVLGIFGKLPNRFEKGVYFYDK